MEGWSPKRVVDLKWGSVAVANGHHAREGDYNTIPLQMTYTRSFLPSLNPIATPPFCQTARTDFTAAFKAYEEAGNGSKTIACLKYLLLAAMLSGSKINPFDSQASGNCGWASGMYVGGENNR